MCRHLAYLGPAPLAALGAHRPAARPVPAVVGAAAAAARDGERRRVRGRLVRRRATRRRPATGGPGRSGRDQSFADLARVTSQPGACWPPSAAPPAGTDAGGRGRAVRGGPLAVQPQRRGRRLAAARRPRAGRACPPADLLSLEARMRLGAASGRWSCTGCTAGDAGGPGAGRHRPRGRRGGARLPAQPAAHRRRGDRGDRLAGDTLWYRATGPGRAWSWPPSRRRRARLDARCPDGTLLMATPQRGRASPRWPTVTPPPHGSPAPRRKDPDLMTDSVDRTPAGRLPRRRTARRRPGRADRHRPSRCRPSGSTTRSGSELFEKITQLPEYYPTRAEREILRAHAAGDRRPRPAPARWSSSARAPRTRPGCCSTRCATPARCAATCRSTSARPR